VVTLSDVVPSIERKDVAEPLLIVFLNKLDFGKCLQHTVKQLLKNKIESNTSSRSFRDPSRIDNRYTILRLGTYQSNAVIHG
jgi:hypothetical protein